MLKMIFLQSKFKTLNAQTHCWKSYACVNARCFTIDHNGINDMNKLQIMRCVICHGAFIYLNI